MHRFRTILVFSCVICALLIYVFRLIDLQILRGHIFRMQADENRTFTRRVPAPRGVFLDRKGVVLVQNIPEYKRATEETFGAAYPEFVEIEEQEALDLLAHDERNVVIGQAREYLFGAALAPVLGYLGEVTKEELQNHVQWYPGQSVGKIGLERSLQEKLEGHNGKEIFEMHARGTLQRSLSKEAPISGMDVKLTIDSSLSAQIYNLFEGKKGAAIVSVPQTGEILALVSSPSYDPKDLSAALTDEKAPMLNRPISGAYPPGSVFKIVTALAGLTYEAIDKDTKIVDEGVLKVGEFSFGNWYFSQYGRTEGEVDLIKAIQRSNDIYFYKTAEWVGPERLASLAKMFHFGEKTGIDLSGEVTGTIPDPSWKAKVLGEQWYLGNTYHMGIGQGDVLVTPIQVNQMTAAVANNGTWCKPYVIAEDGTEKKQHCEDTGMREEDIALVRQGMIAACATGGTAFPFFDGKPVVVACKTGTAEFGAADEKQRRKTHAWFTAFAPAESPTVAVTVLLESQEPVIFAEGSRDAAPIAKKILTLMFH